MKANDVLYGLGGTVRKKAEAYLAEQKGQLDTETRRKVRVFWVSVCVVSSAVCGVAGGISTLSWGKACFRISFREQSKERWRFLAVGSG